MPDTTHPSVDPIGTVRVHPEDDPAQPGARRRIKLPTTGEPGWYWRSLTPEMVLPGPVASDQVMESWPVQDLKDVAVVLGHTTSGPGGLRERVAERFRDLWNYRDANSACWEAADRAITMLAPELSAKDTERRAELDRIATAMHLKPDTTVDSLVRWGENHIESIRTLVRERDGLRADMEIRQGALNDVLERPRDANFYTAVEDVSQLRIGLLVYARTLAAGTGDVPAVDVAWRLRQLVGQTSEPESVEQQAIELDLSQIPEHLRLSDVQRTFRAAGLRLRFEVDEDAPDGQPVTNLDDSIGEDRG